MAPPLIPARFFEEAEYDTVRCKLCPHDCAIAPSRTGMCGIRSNRNGTLQLDIAGRVTSELVCASDELPLYHYRPSIRWAQYAGRGCTMRCPFCNTYKCSQTGGVRTMPRSIDSMIDFAKDNECGGIAFGVNDPAPMHEFVYATFAAARMAGLETHLATAGMWNVAPLREMTSVTSAVTIGLKGLDPEFLAGIGGHIDTILKSIDLLLTLGIHVEFTWLLVPGKTSAPESIDPLLAVLNKHQARPPLILLPYAPDFTWSEPGAATLQDLGAFREAITERYPGEVYEAHVDSLHQNTVCAGCGKTLVRRGVAGLIVSDMPPDKPKDKCPGCNAKLPYQVG